MWRLVPPDHAAGAGWQRGGLKKSVLFCHAGLGAIDCSSPASGEQFSPDQSHPMVAGGQKFVTRNGIQPAGASARLEIRRGPGQVVYPHGSPIENGRKSRIV